MTERVAGTVVFTAFLVLVLGIAVQGAFQTRASIADTFNREADIQRARLNLQEMLRLQTDEENLLRGFVLTRDPFYSAQYAIEAAQWMAKDADVRSALISERMYATLQLLALYENVQGDWRRRIAQRLFANPGAEIVSLDKQSKSFTDYEEQTANGVSVALDQERTTLARSTLDQLNVSSYVRAFWLLIFGLLAIFFNGYGSRVTRQLAEERMVSDVLQQAFRSGSVPIPQCEVGTAYLSASSRLRVGGDVYDVFLLAPSQALVTIADVSGKGLDAAVLTAYVRFTIRAIADRQHDPGEILAEFNRTFGHTVDNASLFITMLVGVLDSSSGSFSYASGGHDSAYLRRGGRAEALPVTGPLLGVMDATYATRTIALEHGDTIVLATDGLTETRSRSGELLGEQGAIEWIAAGPQEAQPLADDLKTRVRKRSGNRPADDLALLVVRYLGDRDA